MSVRLADDVNGVSPSQLGYDKTTDGSRFACKVMCRQCRRRINELAAATHSRTQLRGHSLPPPRRLAAVHKSLRAPSVSSIEGTSGWDRVSVSVQCGRSLSLAWSCEGAESNFRALWADRAAPLYRRRGRAVTMDIDQIPFLQRSAVLRWNFSHFAVFDRVRLSSVHALDPSVGPRRVSTSDFRRL